MPIDAETKKTIEGLMKTEWVETVQHILMDNMREEIVYQLPHVTEVEVDDLMKEICAKMTKALND